MLMDPTHNTTLNDLIKEVCELGSARIEERILLSYHPGAKNIAKAIWRDLEQRFQDEVEKRPASEHWNGHWLAANRIHGYIILVAQEPLDVKQNVRWWKSVARLADLPVVDTLAEARRKKNEDA